MKAEPICRTCKHSVDAMHCMRVRDVVRGENVSCYVERCVTPSHIPRFPLGEARCGAAGIYWEARNGDA